MVAKPRWGGGGVLDEVVVLARLIAQLVRFDLRDLVHGVDVDVARVGLNVLDSGRGVLFGW